MCKGAKASGNPGHWVRHEEKDTGLDEIIKLFFSPFATFARFSKLGNDSPGTLGMVSRES